VNTKDYSNDALSLSSLNKGEHGPTRLEDVNLSKEGGVHLVTRGAARKRIKLTKGLTESSFMSESEDAAFAIDVLKQDTNDSEEVQKAFPGLPPEAYEALTGAVKLTKSVADELPSDTFDKIAQLSGFAKASKPADDGDDDDDDDGCDGDGDGDGTTKSRATKMKKTDIEKALAKIEKKEDIDLLPEDVQKAVRPLYRMMVEKDARIEKLESDAVDRIYVQKAASYEHIAKGPDFIPLLKYAGDVMDESHFKRFIQLLDAHEEMLAKGDLFAEFGSEAESGTDAQDPLVRWDALAKEAVRKSGGAVTYEQAYTDIVHADPEGYNENLARVLGGR